MAKSRPINWSIPGEILRWPLLSGECKLAFAWLWQKAGNQPGVIRFHFSELANFFGRSDRSVRRWIKRLDELGLIEHQDTDVGLFTIKIPDPGKIARRAKRRRQA